jgi:hypothetical protein
VLSDVDPSLVVGVGDGEGEGEGLGSGVGSGSGDVVVGTVVVVVVVNGSVDCAPAMGGRIATAARKPATATTTTPRQAAPARLRDDPFTVFTAPLLPHISPHNRLSVSLSPAPGPDSLHLVTLR